MNLKIREIIWPERRQILAIGVIVLAITGNLIFLLTDVVVPLRTRLASVQGSSSWERSARLSFGNGFADYTKFILEHVPENGRVVLPPVAVNSTYGNAGIMQFFLFPRSIVNCPRVKAQEECLDTFQGENTYFLSIQGFPDSALVELERPYLPFNDDYGIYQPVQR